MPEPPPPVPLEGELATLCPALLQSPTYKTGTSLCALPFGYQRRAEGPDPPGKAIVDLAGVLQLFGKRCLGGALRTVLL